MGEYVRCYDDYEVVLVDAKPHVELRLVRSNHECRLQCKLVNKHSQEHKAWSLKGVVPELVLPLAVFPLCRTI